MISKFKWLNSYEFESHYFYLFDKKLLGWNDSLTWYQSFDNRTVTGLNLIILIYLIKIKYKVTWICASFKIKVFLFERMYWKII
jgi:hypothetical protein